MRNWYPAHSGRSGREASWSVTKAFASLEGRKH
jgi:hypothetical protein